MLCEANAFVAIASLRRNRYSKSMLRRAARLLVVLFVLVASISTPAFASVRGANSIEIVEVAELHCDGAASADERSQSPSDVPGSHHHHCGHGIAVPEIALAASIRSLGLAEPPAPIMALGSYSQAPPTEPPSA